MGGERGRQLDESYGMNGGDGEYSYSQNSSYQRGIVESAREIISREIAAKLDIPQLCSSSPFRIADFGCSSGPNTIIAVQIIIEALDRKFKSSGPDFPTPEFQVFFNDHVLNDFNTLFRSLSPERKYYAAGVPGSFYSNLFPKETLHLAHSSCALCWVSEIPGEVTDRSSPAWNGGRIHYTGAAKEVYDAYSARYAKDLGLFLDARARELVVAGLMVLLIPAVPNEVRQSETTTGSEMEVLGSCLVDMAKKGYFSEEKVDSFNLPIYYSHPNELKGIIKKNGKFRIERMETLEKTGEHATMPSVSSRTLYFRAVFEVLLAKHFGSEFMDELFKRYHDKVARSSFFLNPENQKSTVEFVLLKRSKALFTCQSFIIRWYWNLDIEASICL